MRVSPGPRRRVGAALAIAIAGAPSLASAQGMPQLDFSTPLTTAQVYWGVLLFALLYVLLARWALPQVGDVLRTRAATIEADLETARAAKARADVAVAEMAETLDRARAESYAAVNRAVDRAKQDAAAQAATVNARLEARLQEAEASIAEARKSAMAALGQVATDTASAVVRRLVGAEPETGVVSGAVDQALATRAG